MNTDSLRYAGFWSRLGSLLLDLIIMLPLAILIAFGSSKIRLFDIYTFIPIAILNLFYSVYLVQRYGGTPGKLIVGIRIRKIDGEPVGYREAILRYSVDFIFYVVLSIGFMIALFQINDTEYHALSRHDQIIKTNTLLPFWFKYVQIAQGIWLWGELIVLLTNKKRRALHDFIAGTVVIHATPKNEPSTSAVAPIV
jgi:uncharacterized RDD family membrane protein YckC